MAQPVWVLSVDLQTKTATFQTGLADAAKSARGAFTEIKSGAQEMGAETGHSMMEARHGVMLLGEEFGVHLPRAVATFLASIGPIGAAMETAFPFLAVAALATILIEHLNELHAAGVKLTQDQLSLGTVVNNVWNGLDQKIVQAQIRSDELSNNHLGALHRQLELIDKESLGELVHSFEEVAKAADVVLKDLEGHWYTFGKGSEGAKNSLDDFKAHYESLIAAGKGEEASGLLHGTLAQAQKVLDLMQHREVKPSGDAAADTAAYQQAVAAHQQLDALGISTGANLDKQVEAQHNLVQALEGQVGAEQRIADLKKLQSGNDTKQFNNDESAKGAAAARAAAESQQRIAELGLSADKATGEAALQIHQASLEARLALDIEFAGRDRDIKLAANQAEIAGLDKSGKDYQNQLKALGEKTAEIQAEYSSKVTELKAKESVAANARNLQNVEEGEREKIDATQEGSAARLVAISAAIKNEEALNLQNTEHYRELLAQRVEATRQEAEEEAKIKDAVIKQDIAARNAAAQEQTRHSGAMSKIETPKGSDDLAAKAVELQKEYEANHAELVQELADSQLMGVAKVAEQKRINAQIEELDKKHRDQMDENAAAQAQAAKVAAMDVANAWAQSMLKVAEGHESMAKLASSAFDSIIKNSLQAMLMEVAHEKTAQLAHAEAAAAAAWHAMAGIPVVGPFLGAAAAAATFAGAMAFEGGTDMVPGVGRGDIVPSMLTPGEGVVPGGVMDGLRDVARSGGFEQRSGDTHIHVRPTYHVQTIDGDGMREALDKHTAVLQRHFEKTVRR